MLGLRTECRVCGAPLKDRIIGFAPIPVAGIYIAPGTVDPDPVGPLTMMRCDGCSLVQLQESVDPTFYSQYKFLTGSGGYGTYLQGLVSALSDVLPGRARVLEIGSS